MTNPVAMCLKKPQPANKEYLVRPNRTANLLNYIENHLNDSTAQIGVDKIGDMHKNA